MKKNLADIIEEFILYQLSQETNCDFLLSRNKLAQQLSCAPSQISYVLSSRFTEERGFRLESKRGLGGFVRITRTIGAKTVTVPDQEQLKDIVSQLLKSDTLDACQRQIMQVLDDTLSQKRCSPEQLEWISGMLRYAGR